MIERRNPLCAVTQVTSKATTTVLLKARTQQATHNGTLIKLGLLKSGNLMNWWMIERGNPLFPLNEEHRNSSLETTKQNKICRWDPDHSWVGWMIKCEKDKTIFNACCRIRRKTFCDMGNVKSVTLESALFMVKKYSDNWIPSRRQKISQWNRCSTYLQNWCPNKMRSMERRQLIAKILHGNIYLWLVMKESSVFSTQRSTYFQILYCVLVTCTRTPNQTMHGNKAGIQKPWQSWRWANGIRVEYFPRIQYVAAQWRSQKFIVEIRRDTRNFHRQDCIHLHVQRHLMVIERQQERMQVICATLFSICQKIWSRTMVISWSWFREKSGILSVQIVHKVNGTNDRKDDVKILRKRTPSLPCHESIVQRSSQEQRRWKIVDPLLCRPGITTVFALWLL